MQTRLCFLVFYQYSDHDADSHVIFLSLLDVYGYSLGLWIYWLTILVLFCRYSILGIDALDDLMAVAKGSYSLGMVQQNGSEKKEMGQRQRALSE